ncbi:unnamed protein product [Chironomus riparius]|uniref:Uncharacterized protein n=1 Tax=Chironomus riparius TaxID=315576 RepID=A0A9N9RY96_9DIPT|nr:unnamed protein product [Chironomus riparius]
MDLTNSNNGIFNNEAGPSTSKSAQLSPKDTLQTDEMTANEIFKSIEELELKEKLNRDNLQASREETLKIFLETQKILNDVLAFKNDMEHKVQDITATINSIKPIPDFDDIMTLVDLKDIKSKAKKQGKKSNKFNS